VGSQEFCVIFDPPRLPKGAHGYGVANLFCIFR